jgi:hypothetical protein
MASYQNRVTSAAEDAAALVLDGGFVPQWIDGAIFPSEMTYFIALCDTLGVKRVVESGRQDGYSTRILGAWAAAKGVEVVSIDIEWDAERAKRARDRLSVYPVRCVKGDACAEIGRALAEDSTTPTAVLCDGPKRWPAISLLCAAAAQKNVKLLSMHNVEGGDMEDWLRGYDVRVYEDVVRVPGTKFQQVIDQEDALDTSMTARGSYGRSSLGAIVVTDELRRRLPNATAPAFCLATPRVFRTAWALKQWDAAAFAQRLSFKLYGADRHNALPAHLTANKSN